MEEVRDWLTDTGLGQYAEIFEDQGWDDLRIVSAMSEEDIKTCITKPGHIKKAKLAIHSLRERFHRESRILTNETTVDSFDQTQVGANSEIKTRQNQTSLCRQSDDTATSSLESITRDDSTVAKGPAGDIFLKTKAVEEPATQIDLSEDMRRLPATDISDDATMHLADESKAIGNVAQSITPKLNLQTRDAEGLSDDAATCSLENITRDYSTGAKDQAGDTFLKTKADEEPPTQSDLTEDMRGLPATNISDDATVQLAEESKAIESVAQSITPSKLDLEEELQTEDDDTSTDDEFETTERALIVSENQPVATLRQSYAAMSVSSSTIVKDSKNITIAEKIEVKNINQADSRYDNFTGQIRTAIRYYKKKEPLFVKTRAYTEVCDILDDRHWTVIVGNAGDGKSTMVHHLLLEYLNKGYEPVIVTSTDDWKNLVEGKAKHSNKQFVIIDDMFGALSTDKLKLKEWMVLLNLAETVVNERKGELKVACTTRKYIWSEVSVRVSKLSCMGKLSVVDLTDFAFLLSHDEKSRLLETYFMFYKVEKQFSFHDIACITPLAHGFPHCVEIFCTNPIIREQGISFFKTPLECIKKEMEYLKSEDKAKMCVLILTLLSDENVVGIDILHDEDTHMSHQLKQALSLAGLPANGGPQMIFDEFINMNNVYIVKIEEGVFTFKHESFKEMLSIVLTKWFPLNMVELLDIAFIAEHTKFNDNITSDDNFMVVLPFREKVIDVLIYRLTEEILTENDDIVCKHNAWDNEEFITRWLANVTNESLTLALDNGFLDKFASNKKETALLSVLDSPHMSHYCNTENGKLIVSSALVYACATGCSSEVLNKLIKHGADVDSRIKVDVDIRTMMLWCLDLPTVHTLSCILDLIEDRFCTPLSCSVYIGNAVNVKFLLGKGASVFIFSQHCGKSVVFLAVERNYPDILTCLLDHIHSLELNTTAYSKCQNPVISHIYGQDYTSFFCNLRSIKCSYHKESILELPPLPSELCPIHIAYNVEMLEILYSRGATANASVKLFEYTIPDIIHRAVNNNLTGNVIDVMARYGVDIKAEFNSENMLHVSCYICHSGLRKLVLTLLKHGVNINARNNDGRTPLVVLFSSGKVSRLHAKTAQLLITKEADVNIPDHFGRIPLFYALSDGIDLEYVPELIDLTDVRGITTNAGETCFHFLDWKSNTPYKNIQVYVNKMLDKGADINRINNDGYCPLSLADTYVMRIFLESGAQAMTLDKEGRTIVMKLLCRNAGDICKTISILLSYGMDLLQTDNKNRNGIHYLVTTDYADSVKLSVLDLFLKEKCDIDTGDTHRVTPLMLALESRTCNKVFVACFIGKGACITKVDDSGKTVFDYLLNNTSEVSVIVEIYELLVTQLANFTDKDFKSKHTYSFDVKHVLNSQKNDEMKSILLSLIIRDTSCEYVTKELKRDFDIYSLLQLPCCVEILASNRIYLYNLFAERIDIAMLPETDTDTKSIIDSMLSQNINIEKHIFASNGKGIALQLAKDGKLKSLQRLLESSYSCADVQLHTDFEHNTILHCLLSNEHDDEKVLDVLDRIPVEIYANVINKKGETPLITACQQNVLRPQCISSLIAKDIDINYTDHDGKCAVHHLIKHIDSTPCGTDTTCQVAYVLIDLLDKHAYLDIQDSDGRTALMHLFMSSNICQFKEVIQIFVSNSRNLDQRDNKGLTTIQYCNSSLLDDEVKLNIGIQLLQKGVPFNVGCLTGSDTPSEKWLSLPSTTHGKSQNHDDIFQYIHNCEHDQQEPDAFLHLITTAGIDVNCDTDICGITLLGQCCRHLCHELVEALLDHGANPNVPDCMGLVPLHRLLFSQELSLSNIYLAGCFGEPVITRLIFYAHSNFYFSCEVDTDEVIKEFGVEEPFNFKDLVFYSTYGRLSDFRIASDYLDKKMINHDWTLQMFNTGLRILHELLTHQADPIKMDIFGKSPLHYCVESPTVDGFTCLAMEMLIAHGADVNLEDFEGRTPLMLCAQYAGTKYRRMNILIRAGAKLDAVDYSGRDITYYSRLGIAMMARNEHEEEVCIAENPTLSRLVLP